MNAQHAVLWMDHEQAVILGLAPQGTQRAQVRSDHRHFHGDTDALGSRIERDRAYFAAVAKALGETPEVLLLGPGRARSDFFSWLRTHHPDQARRILKSTAWDRAGDAELAREGWRFFKAADRMQPQPTR